MADYTVKNEGLVQALAARLEEEINAWGATVVSKRDLGLVWEGGHRADAPFEKPLLAWCEQHGWTHEYRDYGRAVRLCRA